MAPEVHELTQRTRRSGEHADLGLEGPRLRARGQPARVGEGVVDLIDHVLVDERQREGIGMTDQIYRTPAG